MNFVLVLGKGRPTKRLSLWITQFFFVTSYFKTSSRGGLVRNQNTARNFEKYLRKNSRGFWIDEE